MIKPGFSFDAPLNRLGSWKRHGERFKSSKLSYKKLSERPWQEECFNVLKDKLLWIITAPMGSGKTLLICALAYEKLVRNSRLRVLISVPQTVIADGFVGEALELPSGDKVDWNIRGRNDLCSDSRDPIADSTVAHTLQWLNRPASLELEDRVLICAHATLAEAYSKDAGAFRDVLVVIDEAHHATCVDEQFLRIQNKIGALVGHAAEGHIEMGLTTATFFRSDSADIVPTKHLSCFTRYRLGFPEFLESVHPFKKFSYDFVLYDVSWLNALKRLFSERIGKTIVYIPAVNTRATLGGKHHDVGLVLEAIAGKRSPVIRDADKPVLKVKRGNKWIRVVNLVDETRRGYKKEAIFNAQRHGKAEAIDVIIALKMFREGANWEWADREIIIGPRGSLVDLLQTIGRLFRRPKGLPKPHARVVHLLTKGLASHDAEATKAEMRTNLNDYLKAVFASMLLEQVFTAPVRRVMEPKNSDHGGAKTKLTLIEVLGSVSEPDALMARIFNALLEWQQRNSSKNVEELKQVLEGIARSALEPYGLAEVASEVALLIWAACVKRSRSLRGIDVRVLDIELLLENPLDVALAYTSGMYEIKDLRDLRSRLRDAFVSFDEARAYARSLGLKTSKEWYDHVRKFRQQSLA